MIEKRHRASCIVISNEGLLVVRLKDPHTQIEHWYPPGGKIEPNEDILLAATRETFEETGVEVNADRSSELILTYRFNWNAKMYLTTTHFFKANVLKIPSNNNPRKDASYNIGWGWLEQSLWDRELSFCPDILHAVKKLGAI